MEIFIKLDRLKLPNASISPAENIFQEISKETGAVVLWEPGVKPVSLRGSKSILARRDPLIQGTLTDTFSGTKEKSRKEPLIKISGTIENVEKARDMLLEKLEIQSDRVVMKLEVPYHDHPTLIGKGGELINKVRKVTGCHIHFPDANKDDKIEEKNNQVSIYGHPKQVERARVMMRALTPIQIQFEAPKTSFIDTQVLHCINPSYGCPLPEAKLLLSYNGLFLYSSPRPDNSIVYIVRCNQDQFTLLRKDITVLMECICSAKGANLPPVHIVMDIIPKHHAFVKGHNNSNIEEIVKRTGAKITFPDIISSNFSRSEKRWVTITGSLDSVYVAWLEIMNFLPVTISFDVNCTRETKGEYKDFLQDLGIKISTSDPNLKYFIKNVSVKGPEKFSKQMLQYRQHLLRLPRLGFNTDIEDIKLASDFLPPSANVTPPSVTISRNIDFEALQHLTPSLNNTSSCKQLLALTDNVIPFITNGSIINKDHFVETGYYITSTKDYKVQSSPLYLAVEQCKTSNTGRMSPNENGCYWKSKMAENSNTLDQLLSNNNWMTNIQYENVSTSFAEMTCNQSSSEQSGESSLIPQSLFMENQNVETTLAEDYYRKKALAARAKRRPIESMESAQVPTSFWAGYGFSNSMPADVIKDSFHTVNQLNRCQFSNCSSNSSSGDSEFWENNVVMKDCKDGDIWSNRKEATFSHSNYFDLLSNRLPYNNAEKNILPEVLWKHGLYKYIDIFTKHEVDFSTFLKLTEYDLHEMGIALQARIKLICLIRELEESSMKLQSSNNRQTFDAAPGAERKSSLDRLDNLQIC